MEFTVKGADSSQIIIVVSLKLEQWWCFEVEIYEVYELSIAL